MWMVNKDPHPESTQMVLSVTCDTCPSTSVQESAIFLAPTVLEAKLKSQKVGWHIGYVVRCPRCVHSATVARAVLHGYNENRRA